jgi:DNA invertase Pin-like site-specific DNA recombinase
MTALLIGYTRCSTDSQDLTAQRDAPLNVGVEIERIYVDRRLTGTNRSVLASGPPRPDGSASRRSS